MPSSFTKEERVMFDDMIAGFDDQLVIAKSAEKYEPLSPEEMVHTRDRFWVPAPMISASFDGFDQTSNFGDLTELSVPVSVGFHKVSPKRLSAKDLRNKTAMNNFAKAAKQKLSSDINYALFQRVALEGSIFVKRTVSPTGYDDIALNDAAMTEIGIPSTDRVQFLAPRVYNSMAGDLAKRAEATTRSSDAYGRAMINSDIAGFEVFKNDQSIRLGAATGGTTTVNGANQYWVPSATTQLSSTEQVNLDNRYSTLTVTAVTYANIKAGDAFTIAGVNSVHMVSKQDTGQLQTFRVISKPSAGVIQIAPALISGQGATSAELEYKNVTATPANGAAITWLNTTTAELNPFFVKGSLLLIPGSFTVDPEDGWNTMRATTDLGIAVQYTRQGEINDLSVKARWDIDFGTSLLNPQMAGNEAFGQA